MPNTIQLPIHRELYDNYKITMLWNHIEQSGSKNRFSQTGLAPTIDKVEVALESTPQD